MGNLQVQIGGRSGASAIAQLSSIIASDPEHEDARGKTATSPGKASIGNSDPPNSDHHGKAGEEAKALNTRGSHTPTRVYENAEESKAPDADKDAAQEERKQGL